MQRIVFASVTFMASLASLGFAAVGGEDGYRDEIERWRQNRLASLKADDGWLTVSGLFWLKPGKTRIGSDPTNDVLLPSRTPGSVGTLQLADDKAFFYLEPGVKIDRNGTPFDGGEVHSDGSGHPDILALGDVKLILIKRGRRLALRLKDNQSPLRASFAGLKWYPPRAEWRIEAKFIAYPKPHKLVMDTIVGETEVEESPGYVTFEHKGAVYQLEAIAQKNSSLWFVFRDKTSGRTTHGGARQLYADAPKNGVVVLDFNKATNFPCAYIPYATCPLAPPQNRLGLAIEAGELEYQPRGDDGSPGETGR